MGFSASKFHCSVNNIVKVSLLAELLETYKVSLLVELLKHQVSFLLGWEVLIIDYVCVIGFLGIGNLVIASSIVLFTPPTHVRYCSECPR